MKSRFSAGDLRLIEDRDQQPTNEVEQLRCAVNLEHRYDSWVAARRANTDSRASGEADALDFKAFLALPAFDKNLLPFRKPTEARPG